MQIIAQFITNIMKIHEKFDNIQAAVNLRDIDQRRSDPPGQQAAADAGNGAVDNRKQRGGFIAAERIQQFKAAAGGAVNFHHLALQNFLRLFNHRHLPALGIFQIIEQNAGSGNFRPAEAAESI